MKGEVAIICSKADLASMNIANRLLEIGDWQGEGDCGYWTFENNRLIIVEEDLPRQAGIERRVSELGIAPDIIVFACRHKSKEETPWMGGHFTGMIGPDVEPELATAAPSGLKSFLNNLAGQVPEGFRISAEATHHGPTDVDTPSFFAEIGSTESQWTDPLAGEAVARSILGIELQELPTFLGFGGGHYVQRQTEIILETDASFGHMFSNYQIDALDAGLIEEAKDRSGASYAYLDRKSLRSEMKKKLTGILDDLGMQQMRGREIKASFPHAAAKRA
jgi:D-aminoacyl-tRNA deacylase